MFKSYLSARIFSAVRCKCLNVIGLRVVWYSGMVWDFEISIPSCKESFGVPEWLNEDFPLDLTTQNTAWSAVSLSLCDGLGLMGRGLTPENKVWSVVWQQRIQYGGQQWFCCCVSVIGWAFSRDLREWSLIWSLTTKNTAWWSAVILLLCKCDRMGF